LDLEKEGGYWGTNFVAGRRLKEETRRMDIGAIRQIEAKSFSCRFHERGENGGGAP